jgi:peptidyl-prolyl cis-trans isomerase B (cyclophilin B)
MMDSSGSARRLTIGMAMFRLFLSLLLALGILSIASAQGYRPQSGETVLRLQIEGRGDIYIRLFTKEAPKTTSHIINLARRGFYDGQRFHRVVRSPRPFLVQMGAPSSRTKGMDDPSLATEGSGTRIPYENSGVSHNAEGIVSLAAQQGDRDSGDSQFFILLAPSTFLDGNYTSFGRVVQGLEILRQIEKGDRVVSATILGG